MLALEKKYVIKRNTALLMLILVIYLLGRLIYIDRFPSVRVDEVWYIQQAHTFITEGKFAMPVWGNWMNVDKVAYLMMPMFSLTAIPLFKLFGFSYVTGRLVSVMYGFLTIIVIYFLGKKTRDENTGLLAAGIMAIDALFFFETRQIRPEAPVIFFGSLGVLMYLMATTDGKNKKTKYFFSGISLALAVFSHPVGALVVVSLFFHLLIRKTLFRKESLFILSGIAVPTVFYTLFALMDIHSFLIQAETNWVRIGPSVYQSPPINRILMEPSRYIFYLLRYKSFTFFALAIAALAYSRKLKDEKTGIIKYFAVAPLILLFLVPGKSHWYLSSVLPYFSVLIAILVADAGKKRLGVSPGMQAFVLLIFAAHIAYAIGGEAYIVHKNKDFNYAALCEHLRPHVKENAVILGSPPLWFCFADKKFYTVEIIERLAVVENTTRQDIISKYRPEYYLVDEDFITNYMDPEFRAYLEGIMNEGRKITETTDPIYGKVTLYRGPYYPG